MDLVDCDNDFSLLPAHIITKILLYLKLDDFKNASTLCKSWYYASTDPQIVRTLILRPRWSNFTEICKSNRRYGILKLQYLVFDIDSIINDYIVLFEKMFPFVYELHINNSDLQIHHLLKILELTTRLEFFSFSECNQLVELPGLFPLDYDCDAKNRIIKNLLSITKIKIEYFTNIPFIADIVRYAPNLKSFSSGCIQFDEHASNQYKEYFAIFDNYDARNLTHLNLEFEVFNSADEFIASFVKIKNLNLKSFKIILWWNWDDGVYKSYLFREFILKLQSLEEFSIDGLTEDQLFLICQHLVNLRSFDCRLRDDDNMISELANLRQLKKLYCSFWEDTHINFDKLFKCRFEYLQIFRFEEIVSESNLIQFCKNHPNLIELHLTHLLTRNLEIIFKHLQKLRYLTIYFHSDACPDDSNRTYDYKISCLQDLERFYLGELVHGIAEDDVKQLKKLRSTNLLQLFYKCRKN